MANYKVPRVVEVVDALPLNATGKVEKNVLRARAAVARRRPGVGVSGLESFAGLRVVELGVWVAAPAAAALLADWGADVIKVEPPTGDPMRNVFGSLGIGDDMPNPAFALDNRGKRSVVLDLRDEADAARLHDLLATADVFISNLRPDALDKLGLEPEATVARHPRLVYCSVSGYGLHGDDRNRPTYDIGAFWARSGLAAQMADGDGNPLNARGGIGDHITGLAALAGVLAAVMEQRQTGKGRVVEVSLLRTGAYVLGWDLGIQMALGKVAGAEPRHRNQAPLMNPYRAADGRWFFFTGLEAARHLPAVCRALGRPDLLDDPRFASAGAIRKHRTEVIALLDELVATRPLDEWAERFDREGVWWAPAQVPAEVVADPQLIANDGFVEIDAGGWPPAAGRCARSAARSASAPPTSTSPPPAPSRAWASTPTRCSPTSPHPPPDPTSAAHPIAQVKHPVALDHHVRVLQQVLRVDRPEVALAGPEHDGHDVHAHLVDQARGQHLATDVTRGDLDYAVTRKLLRLGHGCLDAVDEVERRLGVPTLGLRPVRHDDHVVDPTRRLPVPAVRHVEDVAAGDRHPDLVPVRPDVVVGRLRHLHVAALVQRDVTAGQPVEQRSGLVLLVRDEAVHRHRGVHHYFAHGLSSAWGAPKVSVS